MLNFIIYEKSEKLRDRYFSVIDKFIGESKIAYEIIEIKKYTKEEILKLKGIDGSKIYLLDVEMPLKSGLDFAKEIRETGDWESQLIMVTSHENLRNYDYQRKILMLAFVSKLFDLEEQLLESIRIAHKILTSRESLKFQKNNEFYSIPFNEVLFIEKEQEEVYCHIETKEEKYITNKTLTGFNNLLKCDPRFIRTHRNYIINTYNIRYVDFDDLVVKFDNDKIAFVSKNYKKKLKDKLFNELKENIKTK